MSFRKRRALGENVQFIFFTMIVSNPLDHLGEQLVSSLDEPRFEVVTFEVDEIEPLEFR